MHGAEKMAKRVGLLSNIKLPSKEDEQDNVEVSTGSGLSEKTRTATSSVNAMQALGEKTREQESKIAELNQKIEELEQGQENPALLAEYKETIELLKADAIVELDVDQIVLDGRIIDRLEIDEDQLSELVSDISLNGQLLPIKVRPHPELEDVYVLIYGARRLEAIKNIGGSLKIKAYIDREISEEDAIKAQFSENSGRKDYTYLERCLHILELEERFAGQLERMELTQLVRIRPNRYSEMKTISYALGKDILIALGDAKGAGRPICEELAKLVVEATKSEEISREDIVDYIQSLSAEDLEEKRQRVHKVVEWLSNKNTASEKPARLRSVVVSMTADGVGRFEFGTKAVTVRPSDFEVMRKLKENPEEVAKRINDALLAYLTE